MIEKASAAATPPWYVYTVSDDAPGVASIVSSSLGDTSFGVAITAQLDKGPLVVMVKTPGVD
jgi:hypothetical protein